MAVSHPEASQLEKEYTILSPNKLFRLQIVMKGPKINTIKTTNKIAKIKETC